MKQNRLLRAQIEDLLRRFPKGFAVSPKGAIYEVRSAWKDHDRIPYSPDASGYLVVASPVVELTDEMLGVDTSEVLATKDGILDAMDNIIEHADRIIEDGAAHRLYDRFKCEFDGDDSED